jgi:hypothetical protein
MSTHSQMAEQDIICSNRSTNILTYSYGASKYFLHICASNVSNFSNSSHDGITKA